MKQKKIGKKKIADDSVYWYHLMPLASIIAIAPMIVRLKVINLDGEVSKFWTDSYNFDFFSYYKMAFLSITVTVAIVVFLYLLINQKITIRKTKVYIPMGIYTLGVVLSTVLSEYKQVSLMGFPDRYEGMLAHLSYIGVLFLTINMIRNEKHVKFLLKALLISSGIIGLIGIGQLLKADPLGTWIGKQLIIGEGHAFLRETINFTLADANRVYGTFYNPNYVGSYVVLVIPIILMLIFSVNKSIHKALFILLLQIMTASLLGSQSRTGIVCLMTTVIVFIIIYRKMLWKRRYLFLTTVLAVVVVVGIVNRITQGETLQRVADIQEGISGETSIGLEDVVLEGNMVSLKMSDATINVEVVGEGQVIFTNEKEEILQAKQEEDVMKFVDEPYSKYVLEFNYMDNPSIFRLKNFNLLFFSSHEGIKFVNKNGEAVLLPQQVKSIGFQGRERFASGRGYIWSRSIPLLRQSLIVGQGADTFPMVFPQGDYIGKYKGLGDIGILVDKPHNTYLQIGINIGVFALGAYLCIIIIALHKAYKHYRVFNYDNYLGFATGGISLSILAYVLVSFFNDSVVSVAPVFWMLLGLLIAIKQIELEKNTV